jgi:hypothetical protein
LTASGQDGTASTPRSSLTSPEPVKDKEKDNEKRKSLTPDRGRGEEEEVEALSEMMCSLVTNNSGETRYIGMLVDRRHPALYTASFLTGKSRLILRILHLLTQGYTVG